MRKLAVLITTTAATVAAVPTTASAAATFGNACTANTTTPNVTILMTAKAPANPLPIAAPSDGVITKATFTLPPGPISIPTTVKTFRPAGVGQFQVVAASASLVAVGGTDSHDVRLPVKAGDLLGVFSTLGALQCGPPGAVAADVIGSFAGDAAIGSTNAYAPTPSRAIPLVATVEPDADGDGYGDETQDKCPQSALFQDECPVVVIDSFAAPEKNALTVLVVADNEGSVTVTGSVKVKSKGGKGKRKSTKIKLNGGTQAVKPGQIAKFKIKYPKALKKALAKSSKPLKASITATATDQVGRITTDKSTAKLPGSD